MKSLEDNRTRVETVDDNVASAEVSEALDLRIDEDPRKLLQMIAYLKAQLAAKRQEKEAERQEKEDLKAQLEATRQEKEAEKQMRLESEAKTKFLAGRVYAPLNDFWTIEDCTISNVGGAWAKFRRTWTPNMVARAAGDELYTATVSASKDESKVPVVADSTRSESCGTEIKNKIWPCDFAGNPSAGTRTAQVSHLLPAAKQVHEQWLDIAAAVLGLPENSSIDVKLKGLRGSETGSRSRDNYTGVVHFTTNKVLMESRLWDGPNPEFLLIPCLSIEEAKAWNGGAYTAIAVAGLPLWGENATQRRDVSDVYVKVGLAREQLYESRSFAAPEQIAVAQQLLRNTMMGLADYIHNVSASPNSGLPEAVKSYFHAMRRDRDWEKIPLPASQQDPSSAKALEKVCLVSFKSHRDETGHPAPDPLLLGMKAAVVWSHLSNFRLIANGIKEHDDYDDYDGEDSEFDDDLLMEEISTDDDNGLHCRVSLFELPIQQIHEFIAES